MGKCELVTLKGNQKKTKGEQRDKVDIKKQQKTPCGISVPVHFSAFDLTGAILGFGVVDVALSTSSKQQSRAQLI